MNSKARREKYTRRILEIVASIHKQKIEISRIIQDNRDTQKLINQLRGRIDRTFAIADEVIFKVGLFVCVTSLVDGRRLYA